MTNNFTSRNKIKQAYPRMSRKSQATAPLYKNSDLKKKRVLISNKKFLFKSKILFDFMGYPFFHK